MAISRPNTVSFRLSGQEYGFIKRKAGALSVGDYARRSALSLDAIDRTAERQAIGKAIRAIHKAIAAGLPDDQAVEAKALLADALRLVEPRATVAGSQAAEWQSSSKRSPTKPRANPISPGCAARQAH